MTPPAGPPDVWIRVAADHGLSATTLVTCAPSRLAWLAFDVVLALEAVRGRLGWSTLVSGRAQVPTAGVLTVYPRPAAPRRERAGDVEDFDARCTVTTTAPDLAARVLRPDVRALLAAAAVLLPLHYRDGAARIGLRGRDDRDALARACRLLATVCRGPSCAPYRQ